jgi:hypothetical protein
MNYNKEALPMNDVLLFTLLEESLMSPSEWGLSNPKNREDQYGWTVDADSAAGVKMLAAVIKANEIGNVSFLEGNEADGWHVTITGW